MDFFSQLPPDVAAIVGGVAAACVDRLFYSTYRDIRELGEEPEREQQIRVAFQTATRAMLIELSRRLSKLEFETVAPAFENFFAEPDVAGVLLELALKDSSVNAEWMTSRFLAVVLKDILHGIHLDLDPVWREFQRVLRADLQRIAQQDGVFESAVIAMVTEILRLQRQQQRSQHREPATPWQFPPRAEHFTGRDVELAWLMDALKKGRTVTLCAAGGMGKTALASEALHRLAAQGELAGSFPDGVVTHSFYGRPATDAAFQTILNAYGAEPQGDLAGAVHGLLASRTALVVLDGAEQAADLTAVRRAIPDTCGVLLTTRLNSQAPDTAWRCELHPLHAAQAVTLLREYAGEWANADADAETLCELVGYLPLALRLAGRYLAARMVSAAEYAADLDALGLRALELDAQHASDSVPKLLDKSVEQLRDEARAAFGVAGLLALRAFDGELVAAALGVKPAQARHALSELVDYGLLVRRADTGRYDTGHALVHSYARTELVAHDGTVLRLGAYMFAQLREHATDFDRVNRLLPHVMAELEHLSTRSLWDEVNALATPAEDYLDLQGYVADREAVIRMAINAATELGNRQRESSWLNNLGNAYASLGQVQEAIGYYEQALAIAREIGDRRGEGTSLGNLGNAYFSLGRVGDAIGYYEKTLVIARETGDRRGEGASLGNLGTVYYFLGQVGAAIDHHEQALAISRETGDRRGEGSDLGNLGLAYASLGQVEEAIGYYEQALAIAREIGDRSGEGNILGNLGRAYADLGNVEEAIRYHEQALVIAQEIGDRSSEGNALGNLGNAYLFLDRVVEAIGYYEQALAISREIGDRHREGAWLRNLGHVHFSLGQVQEAIRYYEQALAIAREIGDRRREANHLCNTGLALERLDRIAEAVEHLEQAAIIYEEIRSPDAEQARNVLARLRGESGDTG